MNFLAINLIATCNIRHLNNKCLKVIGIGSIKNLNTDMDDKFRDKLKNYQLVY